MKILVVEDDTTASMLLRYTFQREGYDTVVASNGIEALDLMRVHTFDVVVTDWMMPKMDGIGLINNIRKEFRNPPFILMLTALSTEEAKHHALLSGADDFLEKPFATAQLVTIVRDGAARMAQKDPAIVIRRPGAGAAPLARVPFVAVGIAASTGGPPVVIDLLSALPKSNRVAYFLVQHGPKGILSIFAQRLASVTGHNAAVAEHGEKIQGNRVYVAPGEQHMEVTKSLTIDINTKPKENYVRPAADPLFRSLADVFGKHSTAVVLTGMGKDGTQGASAMQAAEAKIFIQDPLTAIAPSMPRSIVTANIPHSVIEGERYTALVRHIEDLAAHL